jgi:hypothetical protein
MQYLKYRVFSRSESKLPYMHLLKEYKRGLSSLMFSDTDQKSIVTKADSIISTVLSYKRIKEP